MNFSELGKVIEQLGKDRGIQKEVVIGAIEQAFMVTARKKFGIQGEYEARYNQEDGEIEIFQYKNVVEGDVKDPIVEINHDTAKELDEECETFTHNMFGSDNKEGVQWYIQRQTNSNVLVIYLSAKTLNAKASLYYQSIAILGKAIKESLL